MLIDHVQTENHQQPIIENNVRWLIENKGNRNLMVGARVTITEANIHHQRQIIDYFKVLGIKYIWSDPVFPAVGEMPVCNDLVKLNEYSFDMDLYADAILMHITMLSKRIFFTEVF